MPWLIWLGFDFINGKDTFTLDSSSTVFVILWPIATQFLFITHGDIYVSRSITIISSNIILFWLRQLFKFEWNKVSAIISRRLSSFIISLTHRWHFEWFIMQCYGLQSLLFHYLFSHLASSSFHASMFHSIVYWAIDRVTYRLVIFLFISFIEYYYLLYASLYANDRYAHAHCLPGSCSPCAVSAMTAHFPACSFKGLISFLFPSRICMSFTTQISISLDGLLFSILYRCFSIYGFISTRRLLPSVYL